jgi:hypothetical protein
MRVNGGAYQAGCDEKWKDPPTCIAVASRREDHDSTSNVRKPVEMGQSGKNISVETINPSGLDRTLTGLDFLGVTLN